MLWMLAKILDYFTLVTSDMFIVQGGANSGSFFPSGIRFLQIPVHTFYDERIC
jgi:hypothetical protein